MTNLEAIRKRLILKINHIIFWWYYKKVSDHFKQYTFVRSVDLLRQNYNQMAFERDGQAELAKHFGKLMDEQAKEIRDLKMQMISSPNVTKKLNKMFGTDFINPQDN